MLKKIHSFTSGKLIPIEDPSISDRSDNTVSGSKPELLAIVNRGAESASRTMLTPISCSEFSTSTLRVLISYEAWFRHQ